MAEADKTKKKTEIKRRNRFVGLDDAANAVLDPVFRKRGFANRDLFARWPEIAPSPFDKTTQPERLFWPRREAGADGAILHLRCAPGAALAVSHEGERIARAVNTYFGYFLVHSVKISAEPFAPPAPEREKPEPCPPDVAAAVGEIVETVRDDGLRDALRRLGENIKTRRK